MWEYQTDVDAAGHVLNDGCGSVWSSGTVLPAPRPGGVLHGRLPFLQSAPARPKPCSLCTSATGRLAWMFRPTRPDDKCDLDFGATPNAGVTAGGAATFLGVGCKDGTYYSLDPATGRLRWSTNVVFGGFSGGFIATSAYDGHRVYGSTGIGDFGHFEGAGEVFCDPHNPLDRPMQEPSVHAFDAATGAVVWQANHGSSFAPTTVAGGLTFNGPALGGAVLDVRDAADRTPRRPGGAARGELVGDRHRGRRPRHGDRELVHGHPGRCGRGHARGATAGGAPQGLIF